MIKKFRIVITLLVAVCLITGFCACGNSKVQENKEMDVQQTETDTEKAEGQESSDQKMEGTKSSQAEQAAGENRNADETSETGKKNILVVYFSATGTTKGVAEKIANITDADIYEIIPAEIYSSDDLNYNNSNSRSSVEMNDPDARPEIGSEIISLAGYSMVYLGYPIWWGESPRIMSTFVESYDFDGITIIPFCTSGSSGIGKSGDNLAEQAGSGTWLMGKRFSGSVSESELKEWIDGLQ